MFDRKTNRALGLIMALALFVTACTSGSDDAVSAPPTTLDVYSGTGGRSADGGRSSPPTTAASTTNAPATTYAVSATTAAPVHRGASEAPRIVLGGDTGLSVAVEDHGAVAGSRVERQSAYTATTIGVYDSDEEFPVPSVPYDTTEFRDYGINPRTDPAEDRYSTFALDVDTASYTIGRRFLDDGHLPAPETVRVEEYVNFFDQRYVAPERDAFAIHLEGGPTPFVDDSRWQVLRVGIQSRVVTDRQRPAANLTFVIDVSGSMNREDRLEAAKGALRVLVTELEGSDRIAIVAYNERAKVILESTLVTKADVILDAIEKLRAGGSTNLEGGLDEGYRLARRAFADGAINRVILASDGVANVGNTQAGRILDRVRGDANDGIDLVTLGFGMGNFNDVLLEQLADQGDGFYAYVDSQQEAKRLFRENLVSTLLTVAADAKIQVEFNSSVVDQYRLIGFENRDIADNDFRNDFIDAGEIGAGHSVTAIYEVKLRPRARVAGVATAFLRWRDPDTGAEWEMSEEILISQFADAYRFTSPTFQLSTTVAAYAEILRRSRFVDHLRLEDVLEQANRLSNGPLRRDPAVAEFADLVARAVQLDF